MEEPEKENSSPEVGNETPKNQAEDEPMDIANEVETVDADEEMKEKISSGDNEEDVEMTNEGEETAKGDEITKETKEIKDKAVAEDKDKSCLQGEADSDETIVDKSDEEETVPEDEQDLRMREEPRDLEVDVVLDPKDVLGGSVNEKEFVMDEGGQAKSPIKKKSTSLAPALKKASSPRSEKSSESTHFPKITDEVRLKLLMKPFEEGWKRETVIRATNDNSSTPNKQSDVYYFTPEGRKLRSRVMIQNYLNDRKIKNLTSENFTFEKRIIYDDPYDIVREAGGRKRPIGVTPKGPFANSPTKRTRPAKRLKKSLSPKHAIEPTDAVKKIIPKVEKIEEKWKTPTRKQPVAKKRTGGAKPQTSLPEKLMKRPSPPVNHLLLEEATLCSLDCEGREGMPPSLHCSVCMCLFHPECVKFTGRSPSANFVCKSCKGEQQQENGEMNLKISHVISEASQKTEIETNGSHILSTQNILTPAANALSNLGKVVPSVKSILVGGNSSSLIQNNGNRTFVDKQAPVLSVKPKPTEPVTLTLQRPPPPLQKAPNQNYVIKPPMKKIRVNNPLCNMVLANKPLASLPVEPDVNNLSGQIITLPNSMQNQISTNKTLTLKMNGQTILVPPTCIVKTPEGIKVFLPPNSLPSTPPVKGNLAQRLTQKPTVVTPSKEPLGVISPIVVPDSAPKAKTAALKTPHKLNLCNFSMLNAAIDCLLCVFKYLNAADLARAARVCRTWRTVASIPSLWKTVRLKGSMVSDWESAAKKFNYFQSSSLDMKGIIHIEDSNRTWHQFRSVVEQLTKIKKLEFGHVPATILHAVANKLTELEVLNAEHVTASGEQNVNTNAKLDVDIFGNLKSLQQLRLKGVGGISMHPGSAGGDLEDLKNLRCLSLTTLRGFPTEKFTFLGSLTNLETLEIGDCMSWNEKIYSLLENLQQLVTLRLECGGDTVGLGLARTLKQLKKLVTLELINFKITEDVSVTLKTMNHLEVLSIWPDNSSEAARVNTNVMNAVSEMSFLKSFEWGILQDNTENKNGNGDHIPPPSTIPFLPDPFNPDSDALVPVNHLSISAVGEKLKTCIPSTKICVFKVPSLAAQRLLRNT